MPTIYVMAIDSLRPRSSSANVRTAAVAMCGAAALLALVATCVLAVTGIARVLTASGGAGGDFLSFYAAGDIVRHGGAGLYDTAAQAAAQRALYPGDLERPTGFPLPVFAAWGFAPLSMLPFATAYAVWAAINIALLAALAFALERFLAPVPRMPRRLFVAAFALSIPAVTNIVFGQVDLVIFAALFATYGLLRRERDVAAGAVLAAAVIKPHFLIGVVPMLLVQRRWRALAALSCTAAAILVVPALLTSPSALIDNARFVGGYPGAGDDLQVMAGMMANWRGFVVSVTGSDAVWLWLPGLVLLAAAAFAAAVPAWMRRRDMPGDAQAYGLAVMLPLVASPHLHTQSLVLMFIALALALRARAEAGGLHGEPSQQEAVAMICALFASLFALWVLTAAGLSLTVFLLVAIYAGLVRAWPRAESRALTSTSLDAETQRLQERAA